MATTHSASGITFWRELAITAGFDEVFSGAVPAAGIVSAGRHHHVRAGGHRSIVRRIRRDTYVERARGGAVDADELEVVGRWGPTHIGHPQHSGTGGRRSRIVGETDIRCPHRESDGQPPSGHLDGLGSERTRLAFEDREEALQLGRRASQRELALRCPRHLLRADG
jgi:hypothetical protein